MAILEARRLIYRFFQDRIERGKLAGPIELEPAAPALPEGLTLDLVLHRGSKPGIAIVLLETSLKPDLRAALMAEVEAAGLIVRPVFLASSLKGNQAAENTFLLTTTQRELMHRSRFGWEEGAWDFGGSLHFIDCAAACWTSLRGLLLRHSPQVFSAHSVRTSPMNELLWSESGAEWTHPNEPKAKERSQSPTRAEGEPLNHEFEGSMDEPSGPPASYAPPAWLSGGLVCIGCQTRTNDWQNGNPGKDQCVCKACFANGVRLA